MTGPTDPTEVSPPQWSASPAVPTAPTTTSAAPVAAAQLPAHDTPVSPVTAARHSARKRGAIDVVLIVAAIFAIGGIGFAVGRVTSPAASTAAAAGGGRFQGGQGNAPGGQFPAGGQGGLFGAGGITISGEVVAVTADQLSLKLASGQTIQIPLNGTTTYHSQAPATAADVTTGATVQVQVGRGAGGGPNASPGTGGTGGGTANGGRFQFGPATSVTVVPK